MKRVQSNHRPNLRSERGNTLFRLALLGAVLLLVPSRTEAQIEWMKDARNPVMSGTAYTWSQHVFAPCVLFNADSARYEMWFSAAADYTTSMLPYFIGYAVSDDGIDWTKHETAVLSPSPGTWDGVGVLVAATVVRENGQYKMWYGGISGVDGLLRIGYATSPDGIAWTKYSGNPVMEPEADWEMYAVVCGTVMPTEGGYKMWYEGRGTDGFTVRTQIGYATSLDGITWQKDTEHNPVLTTGATGQWNDSQVRVPIVTLINDGYYMWYVGQRTDLPRQTGLATSPDGIHWTKYDDPSTTTTLYVASDPVLKPSVGQWDGDIVMPGSVSLVGDTLHMWYTGTRSDPATYGWRIGHATSLFVPMGIRDYDDAFMPGEYLLAQNYPNPFNPVSRIRYELPQASAVSLVVYDILGREVVRLVDGYMEAGYHEVQWDGSEAASGIYFARLVTPGYSRSIKMVLLR